jgi:general secretion pathway protein E
MGIEPYLLTSSVVGILAQRLVRMICQSCRVSYEPTGEQRKEFGLSPTQLLYKGTGCLACFGTGYKGRQGIYELLVMSDEIKRQLLRSADASMLRSIALEEGMSALRDEGLSLVRDGITTESEVLRVTRGLV